MKLRVAKKILTNQGNLKYGVHQTKKAETVTKRAERRLAKLAK